MNKSQTSSPSYEPEELIRFHQGLKHAAALRGNDRALYFSAEGPVTVSLQASLATGSGRDYLMGLENIVGSSFNDTLTGDAGPNSILDVLSGGPSGDDTISVSTATIPFILVMENDNLDGGLGNDFLQGFSGDDFLAGGPGND